MADFQLTHFALLDIKYSYLDDGYTIIGTTDVPCHLYCRMTEKPPLKHSLPSSRRGTRFTGDIRFCFTVFEDNEQQEPGDTYVHTFIKGNWVVCHDRWFYFVATRLGVPMVSETAIFHFHFPAPPPPIPDPITRYFYPSLMNRTLWYSWGTWPITHDHINGNIGNWHDPPNYFIAWGSHQNASYFIYRGFLDFDTSPMPITTVVINATIQVYVTKIWGYIPSHPYLYITRGVQHLPPVPADYGGQLPYPEILGKIDIRDMTEDAWNDIPLNATGCASIDPQASTRFCLRDQVDVEDHETPHIYQSWILFHSRQKGITLCPRLRINYFPAERPC